MRKITSFILTALVTTLVGLWQVGHSFAAGSANYSISGGSYAVGSDFAVNVYEDSGLQPIYVIKIVLTYDPAKLQYLGVADSTVFPIPIVATGGSGSVKVIRATTAAATNTVLAAAVSFKALSPGPAKVSLEMDSALVSAGSDVWSHSPTDAEFMLITPQTVPAPTKKPTPTVVTNSSPGTTQPATSSTSTTKPTPVVQRAVSPNPKPTIDLLAQSMPLPAISPTILGSQTTGSRTVAGTTSSSTAAGISPEKMAALWTFLAAAAGSIMIARNTRNEIDRSIQKTN